MMICMCIDVRMRMHHDDRCRSLPPSLSLRTVGSLSAQTQVFARSATNRSATLVCARSCTRSSTRADTRYHRRRIGIVVAYVRLVSDTHRHLMRQCDRMMPPRIIAVVSSLILPNRESRLSQNEADRIFTLPHCCACLIVTLATPPTSVPSLQSRCRLAQASARLPPPHRLPRPHRLTRRPSPSPTPRSARVRWAHRSAPHRRC